MKDFKFSKKIIIKIFAGCLIFCSLFFFKYSDLRAVSDLGAIGAEIEGPGSVVGNYIMTKDGLVLKSSWAGRLESIKNWTADALAWAEKWESDTLAAKAWKSALSNFLNRMAYDTATYLATGDKGQAPMFQTENLGDFLKNTADYAAGDFLEAFGESGALGIKFNVCEPDPRVKFNIGLGLYRQYRPAEPDCTFSEMKNNWEEALNDPNFLNNFQAVFDPRQNDLGIALTMQTGMEEYISRRTEEEEKEFLKSDGWKDVTEDISGSIKTPSSLVFRRAQKAIDDSTISETSYTGNIIADAIDIFVNTLIGKLADKWFGQGLVLKFPDGGYDWSGISDYYSDAYQEGITGAKDRFLSISETNFNIRGDYEVLGELTSCPNPEKAGPTNCVITEKFRQAVSERMMVGEAMEKGFLNPEGLFGFRADGLEPNYNEGYPYRSMLILRKFRIIPIGWELAAQYIEENSSKGARNLRDMVACFDPNDKYEGYSENWCMGLVDPTWVLKAPLNYCKKEGPGPEIVSRTLVGQEEESELAVSRNTNYCADEQACIKENKDGSCEIYGYCTKEKRKWDFGGESCDENFNTCDTFKSREGKTISYLKNTLDYLGCNADNAGCTEYCREYDYVSGKYTCDIVSGEKINLDGGVVECNESNEGCREFIRPKTGDGVNLLLNSSFEEEGTPDRVAEGFHGQWSRQSSNGAFSPALTSIDGLSFKGMPITFSLYLKGCGESIEIGVSSFPGNETTKTVNSGKDWQRFSVTHLSSNVIDNSISASLSGALATCLIDAVKIEFGDKATPYSVYRENGLVYEKLIPDYMEQSCYVDASVGNYNLRNDHAPECLDFARKCNAEEAGCDLYIAVKDRMSVAGKVVAEDYCPSECVGYNEYFQMETAFDSQQPQYFVPSTAEKCSSAAAGCDEFTNLDKLGSGAEAREYYSELKQCRKPDESCREFYTWEGSGDTGYQLRVYQMEADDLSGVLNYGPKQTRNITGECNELIFNKPATDPDYNPDCREFYNKNGQISYRLFSLTISCSENCHPYRRSENNVVASIGEANDLCAAECGGDATCVSQCDSRVASLPDGSAVFCQNGGTWNSQHERCLYNAIPDEGKKCSSAQAGCREYSGSSGANMRFIVNDDIEGGTNAGWSGDLPAEFNPSNESLIVGGKSLFVSGGSNLIYKTLGSILNKDRSYYLSFIAKGSGNFNNIGFGPNISVDIPFELGGENTLGSDWKIYKFNLASLNNEAGDYVIGNEEKLFIGASGNFFIDNIRLVEIVDRYFLIKNSWNSGACLYDVAGNPEDKYYNIGCEAYRDKENQLFSLRRFSRLCQDSAVGCDLMIDTHNSTQFEQYTSNTNPPVIVPQDSFAFVVYDKDKSCNLADKGCEKLGDPYFYENQVIYRDIYLKNDPDKYDDILCDTQASGCESWQTDEGQTYFKDPGDHVCERKTPYGETEIAWYKKEVKRCDVSGNGEIEFLESGVCLDDSDCDSGGRCLLDKNIYECVTENKTIGTGGAAGAVFQPHIDVNGQYWAGLCPAGEAGCTEYVDPLSTFSSNLIFNPDFKDIDVDGTAGDGWSGSSQQIFIEANTPYVFRVTGSAGGATFSATEIEYLDQENNFVYDSSISIDSNSSALFLSENAVNATVSGGASGKIIEIKKAAVDYQIKNKTDKTSCNGLVNFEEGCVLFNERSFGAGGYNSLIWDANQTYYDNDGVSPISGTSNNSQVLLKVDPDRGCETWLTCRSYIKDENDNNVCYNIGLCDKFDENGNCVNIVETDTFNNTAYPGITFADHSGYFKAGYLFSPYDGKKWIDHNSERNDYLSFDRMKQTGEVVKVPNGDFELYGSNGYPVGWQVNDTSWSQDWLRVINNPWEAEREGITYPMNGKSFLKFSPQKGIAVSDFIDVEPDGTYVLSAMMNTMNFSVDFISANKLAAASIGIKTYDKNGAAVTKSPGSVVNDFGFSDCLHQTLGYGCGVYLSQRTDWTPVKIQFTLGSTVEKIRLELTGDVWTWGSFANTPSNKGCAANKSCLGTAYLDNIQINPALQAYKSNFDIVPSVTPSLDWLSDRWQIGWLKERSCRLYPEDDSLSCEYINDSGVKRKGLYGYCLEYDRYPGNTDACLLWYPIDKVKGDGIEEGGGYIGKYPVYYTTERKIADYQAAYPGFSMPTFPYYSTFIPIESFNFPNKQAKELILNESIYKSSDFISIKIGSDVELNNSNNWSAGCTNQLCTTKTTFEYVWDKWLKYGSGCRVGGDGHQFRTIGTKARFENIDGVETFTGIEIYACDTSQSCCDPTAMGDLKINLKIPYASKIVQTVTSFGQNKFWSGRVYEGSNYSFPCNVNIPGIFQTCEYTSDAIPFGSITPPGNTWSIVSNPYEWTKPLYYEFPPSSNGRMGQEHTKQNIQLLFAQSYGTWVWSDTAGRYIEQAEEWLPPSSQCLNAVRGAKEYCFYHPRVKNLKVNKHTVNNSDFVNLTFNSFVDSQQLPLVMYSVDWGDGDKTIVSGVEMRDRPNTADPHSLYHLYSYWELRKEGIVNCSDEFCIVTPRVQIRDNWGINSGFVDLGLIIKVYKKTPG